MYGDDENHLQVRNDYVLYTGDHPDLLMNHLIDGDRHIAESKELGLWLMAHGVVMIKN